VRKFSILRLQGMTFGFDVSWFLAVIARHRTPGHALVSRRIRPARGTSSTILLSITRTLYGVGFTCRVLNEHLPPSVFRQNGARCFVVLYGRSRRVAYGRDEGFLRRWKIDHQQ
jgi:hypothetical protein